MEGLIGDYIESGDFSGSLNSTLLCRSRGRIKSPRLLLVGLGKAESFIIDYLRQISAVAVTTARKLGVATVAILPPVVDVGLADVGQAVAEGALLGLYRLKKYKTETADDEKDNLRELHILASGGSAQQTLSRGSERGKILADAVSMARDLTNSPGNAVNPSVLAETAKSIAKQTTLRCRVITPAEMKKLGMGCLLGVAQGSAQPPVLILLEHKPKGGKGQAPIVLIGKGITFDSGGISIKPAANMEDMKMDMAGGAAVLGIMQALAQLNYPGYVVGLVPASENLPSGNAVKPGDILRAMSGKTVEVINTDAEGRLVLADAISYAVEKLKPARIIDLATLTGAVVVALGSHATGMMGTDEPMMERLQAAGVMSAERVWPLPMFDAYSKQIKSDIADIKNTGGREAGSITGGAFLKEFVGDTPWVHLDIAGTAWTRDEKPYVPKGATGVGIRLLIEALQEAPALPSKS
jgi:leucyl aminopeptidase